MSLPEIVAEPVRGRLQYFERVHVGLLLRGIGTPRREGNLDGMPGLLRGFLDGCASAQNDQVRERYLLPAGQRTVELVLDRLQGLQDFRQFHRLVDVPILLRRQANTGTVRSTALVGAAERRR